MIALDTNILVHAHRAESPWYAEVKEVVRALAEGSDPWAVPWHCFIEFLGVVTNSRVFNPPTSLDHALRQVQTWLASPSLVLLTETS